MKLKELIEHLQNYSDKEQTVAYSLWFIEDVEQQLKDRKIFSEGRENPVLTHKEKIAVLETMQRRHDCNIGMNWEYIDACIDSVIDDR